MQIIRGLINLHSTTLHSGTIVTIGNYDGIHLGHQAILNTVKQLASHYALPSVLITFEPQPREYFLNKRHTEAGKHQGIDATTSHRLLNWREKFTLLRNYGIDKVLILAFNDTLAPLPALSFIREILVDKLHAKHIVIGEDFAFGAEQSGDIHLLQQHGKDLGFQTIPVPACCTATGQRISSTLIRRNLQHGDLSCVQQLLGRPYSVTGKIVAGDQRGSRFGVPTANVYVHHKIIPFSGVYAVRVKLCNTQQPLHGIANIGVRPTIATAIPKRLLEFHIFDFHQNIYGKTAKVEFIHKIREERKFSSLDELKEQIKRDVALTKKFNFV